MSGACPPAEHSFLEHSKSGRIFCTKCGEFRGTPSDPAGIVVMWSGETSTIPSNWQLCDGTNGTPDLRDKFVVGAGADYKMGSTGGNSRKKLTIDQIPSHTHFRHPNLFEELPVVEEIVELGQSKPLCLSNSTVSVAASAHCNVPGCTSFPQCCESTYLFPGHEKVEPSQRTVRRTPFRFTQTGPGGTKDPTPIDIRPPYYALAFIMKMRDI